MVVQILIVGCNEFRDVDINHTEALQNTPFDVGCSAIFDSGLVRRDDIGCTTTRNQDFRTAECQYKIDTPVVASTYGS